MVKVDDVVVRMCGVLVDVLLCVVVIMSGVKVVVVVLECCGVEDVER